MGLPKSRNHLLFYMPCYGIREGEVEAIPAGLWIKSLGQPEGSEFVFPSKANTMLSKYNVGRAFRKAVKRAKVEDFRFHDLRRTFLIIPLSWQPSLFSPGFEIRMRCLSVFYVSSSSVNFSPDRPKRIVGVKGYLPRSL